MSFISGLKPVGMFWSALHLNVFYLLDGLQHGPASVPGLSGLLDAVQAGHAVPLPVLQLPVEGVGKHQHAVIQVQVGHLKARHGQDEYTWSFFLFNSFSCPTSLTVTLHLSNVTREINVKEEHNITSAGRSRTRNQKNIDVNINCMCDKDLHFQNFHS